MPISDREQVLMETCKSIALDLGMTEEKAQKLVEDQFIENRLLEKFKKRPQFSFGDVVVYKMDRDQTKGEVGVIVKTWESERTGHHYEVYLREQRIVVEDIPEKDLSQFPYAKNISDYN